MTAATVESVRAVLLTPDRDVLLIRVSRDPTTDGIWITPGGRRKPGEPPTSALARELREELGLVDVRIGPELWAWQNRIDTPDGPVVEHERAYLVETDRFEPSLHGMDDAERAHIREIRWWSIGEIRRSRDIFVPKRLAPLLETLTSVGPPATPLRVQGLR